MVCSRLQFFIFLFYFFLPCQTLRCTTNCSFTYNLTQLFDIPNQCGQIVSAGKCIASVKFSYQTQKYTVQIDADPSTYIYRAETRRFAYIILSPIIPIFFYYDIHYSCQNTDDCARDLIRNAAIEILQRQFQIGAIENELAPLISSPPSISKNLTLNCYDSKENILQCNTSRKPGFCLIQHKIETNSINHSCTHEKSHISVYIMTYLLINDSTFDVACNRSLCNNNSTLRDVKELMFKHNVTVTLSGRLMDNEKIEIIGNNGSKWIESIILITMMIVALALHS
ncbi:unnamed protein product [Rotaria sp. Silwood1]|nr:unnamed protein product [Rotaria sp. Silwood1]CAF5115954.1 unnamed protein product [Rotaria sp. Silwood1]